MNKIKIIVSIVLLIIINLKLFAQQKDAVYEFSSSVSKGLLNLSNNVNLYHGTLNYNIPLSSVKIKDFVINIGCNYSYNGYKPKALSNSLGLNWSLSLGGIIRRDIKGLPDEKGDDELEDFSYNEYTIKGYLSYPNGEDPEEVYNGKHINQFLNDIYFGDNKKRRETSPDVYSFNFMGHRGQFTIDQNGKPVLIGKNKGYKIQLSLYTINDKFINKFYNFTIPYGGYSYITITTNKGVKYIFNRTEGQNYYATSWYLTKIEDRYGNIVEFDYDTKVNLDEFGRFYLVNYINAKDNFEFDSETNEYIINRNIDTKKFKRLRNKSEIPLLTSISYNNEPFIKISYKEFDYLETFNKVIEEIEILKFSKIKKIKFNYEEYGIDKQQRLFLNNISMNNIGKYSFLYNQLDMITDPLTPKLDHWGFYNPDRYSEKCTSFYPRVRKNKSTKKETFLDDQKDYSKKYFDIAGLNQVNLPSGGKINFFYENHQYFDEKENRNKFIGGARIKKIEEICNNKSSTIEYKYLKDYVKKAINISSGYTLDIRNYYNLNDNNLSCETYVRPNEDNYISYNDVTVIYNNTKYTRYQFTDLRSNPNIKLSYSFFDKKFVHNPYCESSLKFTRGKIKKKEVYNSKKELIENSRYFYNQNPDRYKKFVASVYIGATLKYFLFNDNLTKIYKEKKVKNIWFNETIFYKYDDYTNLIEKRKVVNNKNSITIKYKYPYNLALGRLDPYYFLKSRNCFDIVQTDKFINGIKVSSNKITYKKEKNIIVPKIEYKWIPNKNIYKEVKYFDKYSQNGNLLEYHFDNNHPISLKWDYSKTKIRLKLINTKERNYLYDSFDRKDVNYDWISKDKIEFSDDCVGGSSSIKDMKIKSYKPLKNGKYKILFFAKSDNYNSKVIINNIQYSITNNYWKFYEKLIVVDSTKGINVKTENCLIH